MRILLSLIIIPVILSGCVLNDQPRTIASVKESQQSEQNKTIEVKNIINTGANIREFKEKVPEGTSAFMLLQKVVKEINFSMKFQESDFGVFVEEINGVKNGDKKNFYWMYYVNGESASVGASQYTLQSGDVIEWKFEDTTDSYK